MTVNRKPTSTGFTLVEVIVVVVILGFISAAIASAFVVILRTTPSSEARSDDARSLLSLTNWLSHDVSSTAENGFSTGDNPSGCSGVPASIGLLELKWAQDGKNFVSNYRYLTTSSTTGVIYRYTCQSAQPAQALKLTPELRNVSTGAFQPAPVEIVLVEKLTSPPASPPLHKGLEFVVDVFDDGGNKRELLNLDATTTNVRTTLPTGGGGGGGGNTAPQATSGTSFSMSAGQVLVTPLPVSDLEGDSMTVTLSNIPPGWNITTIGTDAEVTPDPLATPGPYSFSFVATDTGGLSSASTSVGVTITAPSSNQPPSAAPATASATRGLTSITTLNASDPEGGVLTLSLSGIPAGWSVTNSGLDVSITPSATATGAHVINYTVTDPEGNPTQSTITVTVCTVTISGVSHNPVMVQSSGPNAGRLQQDVKVTISRNSGCGALALTFKPKATDSVETSVQFGTSSSATIDKATYTWDIPASPRTVTLRVRQGSNGVEEASTPLTTK